MSAQLGKELAHGVQDAHHKLRHGDALRKWTAARRIQRAYRAHRGRQRGLAGTVRQARKQSLAGTLATDVQVAEVVARMSNA